MGVIKCRGLILNETPAGEADKILSVFTKEMGKIRIYAKGARKLKSRYFSASSQFYYCDFVLFSGSNFYSLTQIDKVESFRNIPLDFNRMCYGNYFLELADKSLYDNEPNHELLKLLITALKVLDKGIIKPGAAARAFEFKFMQISGYTPNMEYCTECGKDIVGNTVNFSHEGILCGSCASRAAACATISFSAVYAIKYILGSEIKEAFSFKVDEPTATALKRASDLVLLNMDVSVISKQMIDDIEAGRL